MFKCPSCNTQQVAGVKPVTVVVTKRERVYPLKDNKTAVGWEIVQEAKLCPSCAKGRTS